MLYFFTTLRTKTLEKYDTKRPTVSGTISPFPKLLNVFDMFVGLTGLDIKEARTLKVSEISSFFLTSFLFITSFRYVSSAKFYRYCILSSSDSIDATNGIPPYTI